MMMKVSNWDSSDPNDATLCCVLLPRPLQNSPYVVHYSRDSRELMPNVGRVTGYPAYEISGSGSAQRFP